MGSGEPETGFEKSGKEVIHARTANSRKGGARRRNACHTAKNEVAPAMSESAR